MPFPVVVVVTVAEPPPNAGAVATITPLSISVIVAVLPLPAAPERVDVRTTVLPEATAVAENVEELLLIPAAIAVAIVLEVEPAAIPAIERLAEPLMLALTTSYDVVVAAPDGVVTLNVVVAAVPFVVLFVDPGIAVPRLDAPFHNVKLLNGAVAAVEDSLTVRSVTLTIAMFEVSVMRKTAKVFPVEPMTIWPAEGWLESAATVMVVPAPKVNV